MKAILVSFTHHNDPQLDLTGKSRADYIDDALNKALLKLAI